MALLPEIDPLADFRRQIQQIRNPLALAQTSITDGLVQYTPEEQESLLNELAGSVGSGLSYVAETLDKPGRALRGLLAGQPGELANLIPFSDAMGLTDPKESVGGRQLLEEYGLLQPNTEGFDLGDVAGFATEVLLDPLLPLSLGGKAATASGKVAAKVGMMPKAVRGAGDVLEMGAREGRITNTLESLLQATPEARIALEDAAGGASQLDELIATGEPLGGVASYFGQPFGMGETGQKIARGMDKLGEAVRYSWPGRQAASLLSYPSRGVSTKEGQIARQGVTAAEDTGVAAANAKVVDATNRLKSVGIAPDRLNSMLRSQLEGFGFDTAGLTPEQVTRFTDASHSMRTGIDELRGRMTSIGFGPGELDDLFAEHFPRYSVPPKKQGGFFEKLFETKFPSDRSRKDFLENIQEGTETINNMTRDRMLMAEAALSPQDAIERIKRDYLKVSDADLEIARNSADLISQAVASKSEAAITSALVQAGVDPAKLAGLSKQELNSLASKTIKDLKVKARQPESIARWLKTLPKDVWGKAFFPDPLRDYERYLNLGEHALAGGEGVVEYIAKHAAPVGPDTVPLESILKKTGFADKNGNVRQAAIEHIAAKLGVSPDDLSDLGMPKSLAEDATRMMALFVQPNATGEIIGAYDKMLQVFKSWVTTPWLNFHSRNAGSILVQNYIAGATSPNFKGPNALLKPIYDVRNIFAGTKSIKGMAKRVPLFKGLSDEQATRKLAELIYIHNLGYGQVAEITGEGVLKQNMLSEVTSRIPGEHELTLGTAGKTFLPGRGEGWRKALPHPIEAGTEVGNLIEGAGRGGAFLSLLERGFDPATAAARVKAMHVDYARATPFERAWAKRVFPFWAFSRGMAEFVTKELMEQPGGRLAQTIRASNEPRQKKGFVPEWIGQGLAVPLPGDSGAGTQRFLTSLGLAHENPLQFLQPGRDVWDTFNNSLAEFGGAMTPPAKFLVEQMTGKQLYTQRDLDELDSRLGRIANPNDPVQVPQTLENLLMNSPLSKPISVAGTLADPRKTAFDKAVTLSTGLRITDIDVDKAKSIASREALSKLLKQAPGVRSFENLYVKQEELSKLSPENQRLYSLYRGVQSESQARARERRKQEAVQ